jgi:cell division transport system permease protein
VSLLIFGLTLLIQHGFDNLLQRWEGGVEMIVFVNAGTQQDGLDFIQEQLDKQVNISIESYEYCDTQCSLEDADRVLAGDPTTRGLLDETTIPTLFKIVPTDGTSVDALRGLKETYSSFPAVYNVTLAEDQLDLISKLQSFVSTYTTGLWIALMFASGLLIWNTIRTAMFARRREIEVMKLVGATDWFIRIPFMLEGLIQGLLGGIAAVGAMAFINWRWTIGVRDFPEESGMTALVVVDGYQWTVAIIILAFGALVGMIGSGIAASRFLDV